VGSVVVQRGDITTLPVDAIVNAANEAFRGGGGVDGAIHAAAGPDLLVECRRHACLPTGEAIRTGGYRLPTRFIVHTVGPVWSGGRSGEPALLRRAYESVVAVALTEGSIRTIAFPAISTGVYGYPKRAASLIAMDVMQAHSAHFEQIVACVFSTADESLYREVLREMPARP